MTRSLLCRMASIRFSALICLAFALLASGCDGGLFGTGDSNSQEPIAATSPSSNMDNNAGEQMPLNAQDQENNTEESGQADAASTAEAADEELSAAPPETSELPAIDDSQPAVDDLQPADEVENTIPPTTFNNTVEPLLRFVNTSNTAVLATLAHSSGGLDTLDIPALGISDHQTLEIGETSVDLIPVDSDSPAVQLITSLGLSSVTTVFVQSQDSNPQSISVFALETLSLTDDASLAQIRLIDSSSNAVLGGPWTLTPAGMNPGASSTALNIINQQSAQGDYSTVTAGGYELRLDNQTVELPMITLDGGSVVTLVLFGTRDNPQLIRVLDSDIVGL